MVPTLWNDILGRIETKVNRYSFYTWFKPTVCVADDGHTLTVKVPNPLFRDWLTKHYSAVLDEALSEVGRGEAAIAFVADDSVPMPAAAALKYKDIVLKGDGDTV